MKLINIKCPNCNATLKIGHHRKRVTCDYCEKTFTIDDEIVKVKHLNVGEITEEQEFINAETNLNKLKNYKDAYKGYWSLSKRYVDDAEIWIGLVRSMTHDFTYQSNDPTFKDLCMKYWNYFVALSDKKDVDKYIEKYKEYCGLYNVQNKEVKSVSKKEDKKKNNVVQYVFFGLLMLCAIGQISYTFLAFFIIAISAILCLDVLWKNFKFNQIAVRIAVPLIVFVIGSMFAITSVPEDYYGIWVTSDEGAPFVKVEFTDEDAIIYKNLIQVEGDRASSTYISTDKKVFIESEKYDYELIFNVDKDGFCLAEDSDDCKYLYLIETSSEVK